MRNVTSSSSAVFSLHPVLRRDSASADCCFILAGWIMSNLNSDDLERHRASFPTAPAIVRIYRSASWSVVIVKRVFSNGSVKE